MKGMKHDKTSVSEVVHTLLSRSSSKRTTAGTIRGVILTLTALEHFTRKVVTSRSSFKCFGRRALGDVSS